MCDTAVALETVTARVEIYPDIGMDIAHRRRMAAQAVVIDGLSALSRNLDVGRIVTQHFMIRIDHARAPLLKHVMYGVVVRQVAVRAFQ